MQTESHRIEFKSQLTDNLEKEAVAFLNYRDGGLIYVGVNDLGIAVGLNDVDGLQLKIKDRIKHNIAPSTMGLFDVSLEDWAGKAVIKITLASGSEKPYYLSKRGMSLSGCFMRVGSASEPMTARMIEELFSDRLEITSAGVIPKGFSEEEFFMGYSVPHNKELMRVFRDLDIVEQMGSGIPRILQQYNPSVYHFTANFIRVNMLIVLIWRL